MAAISLSAFAVGLASVCLPDDVHPSAYYDGDADDIGIVQERHPFASRLGIVSPVAHVAPPMTFHREGVARRSHWRRATAESRDSGSRAPPAPSRSAS
jgi:hypothetical protein